MLEPTNYETDFSVLTPSGNAIFTCNFQFSIFDFLNWVSQDDIVFNNDVISVKFHSSNMVCRNPKVDISLKQTWMTGQLMKFLITAHCD